MAFNNDPRIKKEKEEAELERQRKKEEKKFYKQQQALVIEDRKREQEEKKAAEQQLKTEMESRVKEEKRLVAINFKQKVKELIELCQFKLPGTTYDKFWVESILKRFSTLETLSPIFDFLTNCDSKSDFDEYMQDLLLSQEERQKKQIEKDREESKEIQIESGWTKEEIALLTKGIVKFPPGTKDRWGTIADFVASKSQKEVIKKAQEIA